jgi:hypothetical protein
LRFGAPGVGASFGWAAEKVKRFFRIIAVIAVVLALAASVWSVISAKQKAKREARYQVLFDEYSNALKPGLTRKEAEAYLKSRNIRFTQMCCVGQSRNAWADLVKIGEESAPWYCSEYYVNIAFEFRSTEPHRLWESRDNDVLESARIFRQFGGCL